MAGRRGFGAALLLSLDGGGASFSFLWCSTGIVRHLPTSGAPRQSCSGGLSGARRLLGRRRLEFTVATDKTKPVIPGRKAATIAYGSVISIPQKTMLIV
ncbi:hypothetical protein PVAP13_5NG112122 [Panicum virgatum]|uniref:Secreted protein n=1 Tax=Panicum virgatum TaxID=38727 RepID=A0A8T0S9N1_PANVG|nr:hypothetical protein PVAP13_5NG112122 [Panicum virgatum]